MPQMTNRPASAAEMRELDRRAIEEFGIPGVVLMENAGRAVAEEALKMLACAPEAAGISIVCGRGNNGGDGFVAARHLQNAGCSVTLYLVQPESDVRGDARVPFGTVRRMKGIRICTLQPGLAPGGWAQALACSSLIVDALFGTGLSRPVAPPLDRVIEWMNESGRPILAVDIPSGLHADTGAILGCCVRASRTVSFVLPKCGLLTGRGPEMSGQLMVADIGMPADLLEGFRC